MEPADFVKYRKSAMGTAVLSFVLAVSDVTDMNWGGIKLPEVWAWVFIAGAHAYFTAMMYAHKDLAETQDPKKNPYYGAYQFRNHLRETVGNFGLNILPVFIVVAGALNILMQIAMMYRSS